MPPENFNGQWKRAALEEIASIKYYFIQKHHWQISIVEEADRVILFVLLGHKRMPDRVRMLRLVYGPNFPGERPREGFVNPDNTEDDGIEFWIDDGNHAFKTKHNPPVICLEGTWGFHHVLHRERDPCMANLNKLLLEVQECFDRTS